MNGILVVDKPGNYTSRDIVNIVSKELHTKKVGHTGTLDPIAGGVLVVPIGRALKISELLLANTKEYIAKVILGYETDMLDVTGKETKRNKPTCTKEDIERALLSFIGKQDQEVPMYSAVKVGGKKLYEYARSGIEVQVPTKTIEIYSLELVGDISFLEDTIEFSIKCKVSKGTYIRSLIRDIAYRLGTYGTMKELLRTKVGPFSIDESNTIEEIENNNYNLLSIKEALPHIKITKVDDILLKKIKNGMVLDSFFDAEISLIEDKNDNDIAIYKKDKDGKARLYKMIEV